MKYIDADKLIAEIERLDDKYRTIRVHGTTQQAKEADLVVHVLHGISNFIDRNQQEQSECIEKTARISPGMLSNFGTSTYVLDVDLSQDEIAKMAPFGFNSGNIKIKIVCE